MAFRCSLLALLALISASAEAQPNLPVMRQRSVGLSDVAVAVTVRAWTEGAKAALVDSSIANALRRHAMDQGAPVVRANGVTERTMLVYAKVSCESAPNCAIAMIYSRMIPVSGGRSVEALIDVVGPTVLRTDTWTRMNEQITGYAKEGVLVAARMVSNPRSRP
jgi:hypothetical protein